MTKNKPYDFCGVMTALVTPFKKQKVDFKSLKKLIRQQIENGVQGFVVSGTTGESPTLTGDEVAAIFKFVKKETDKAFPVILGTGSNSTAETIRRTQLAKKIKADAALVVTPYYNKPPQRGLVAHYSMVAKKVAIPILLYNVPARTGVTLEPDSIAELAQIKNIVGIKEASGQLAVLNEMRKRTDESFLFTSGDDATSMDFILNGGKGVISVASHILPRPMRELCDRARQCDDSVRAAFKKYSNLIELLFLEANPIPVKMALHLLGIIESAELRPPLVALTREYAVKIQHEMHKLELI